VAHASTEREVGRVVDAVRRTFERKAVQRCLAADELQRESSTLPTTAITPTGRWTNC